MFEKSSRSNRTIKFGNQPRFGLMLSRCSSHGIGFERSTKSAQATVFTQSGLLLLPSPAIPASSLESWINWA
jgi:hypothetical protein